MYILCFLEASFKHSVLRVLRVLNTGRLTTAVDVCLSSTEIPRALTGSMSNTEPQLQEVPELSMHFQTLKHLAIRAV